MQDIKEYLINKIRGDDLGVKPRRNLQLMRMIDTDGVDMLDFLIDDMISYARKVIQRCFKRNKVEGESAITQASMAIGKYIVESWDSSNVNFRDHVRVGDLVIEGFPVTIEGGIGVALIQVVLPVITSISPHLDVACMVTGFLLFICPTEIVR